MVDLVSTGRLGLYLLAAMWLGSEATTNWRNVLDGNVPGIVATAVLMVVFVVLLLLMWRHDRKRGVVR